MFKFLLILLIIFTPINVFAADECDPSSVKIENVEVNDTRGNIEENSNATSNNNELNLDLNMNVPGDSIEYKLTLKNTSDTDYYFDENSLVKNMDNVKYEFSYSDGDNIVKSGEEKIVILKVTYKDKVAADQLDNGVMSQNNTVTLNLTNKNINVPDTLKNRSVLLIFGVILIIISGIMMIINEKKSSTLLLLIGVGISLVPITVHALCKCELNVNSKIEIDGKEATFLVGDEVNVKMKELAGDDTSGLENGYTFADQNILAIKKSDIEPSSSNKEEKNIVSTPDSLYPIYMWFDNGTIYWWSEDNTPSLNDNSRRMFYNMTKLNDIEGLSTFDTSNASKINILFTFDDLRSIEPLRNWNTSKVTAMGNLLYKNENLNSIKALENWDTSGATSLAGMFYFLTSLESLEGIEKWDVSNVTNMNLTFNNTRIKSVLPLKNWNTSKVTTMEYTFSGCEKLENLDGLENWDTSNVNTMFLTFNYCVSLENMNGIKNWNVSKVTNMHQLFSSTVNLTTVDLSNWSPDSLEIMSNIFGMWNNDGTARLDSKLTYVDISSFSKAPLTDITMAFSNTVNLTKINGIENLKTDNVTSMHHAFSGTLGLKSLDLSKWNTSNVTKMNSMFAGSGLEELDISGFDTRNVTNFSSMFNRSTNLKHIYVGPNWDTSSNIEGTETVFPEISDLPNFDTNNSDYRDLSYAHTGEGGYLTLKTN